MTDNSRPPEHVVVVGSSAGGIEALSTLVARLPADFPAPIVIAQHLDPQRPSHLVEILARQCVLPVQSVVRQTPLLPAHVYVILPDHPVEFRDGRLTPVRPAEQAGQPGEPRGPKSRHVTPSINALFRSAAHAFGDGVIAVVLTGTGSDGAAGALEVKKAGGTVVIQNPQTSAYPGMPLSLAPTAVDLVANIEEMGSLLQGLVTGAAALEQTGADNTLRTLLNQVRQHTGLDFSGYRTPTILRRIARRMAATNTTSLADYRRYLHEHSDEYPRLVSAFLINVSEFFRDPPLFSVLRAEVLPEILTYARQHSKQVRIWSAGCATGEEAYSFAMLVAELLGPEMDQFRVRIFATDLDHDAIAFARRGRYPAAALAEVPLELVNRYFTAVDDDYEVNQNIRNCIVFGEHNLLERPPFPHIDLVLCRNVLMYLTPELQQRVLQLFAYSLREGGYLVLGKAEATNPLPQYFAPVQPALRLFRRHGEHLAIPPRQFMAGLPLLPSGMSASHETQPRLPHATLSPMPRPSSSATLRATTSARLGALMLDLPIGVVVVDRRYDVQAINSLALRLLGIHREAIGDDLLHLARGVSMEALREIIDAALAGAGLIAKAVPATMETGEQHFLEITAYPHRLQELTQDPSGVIDSVLLLVSDVTASVQDAAAAEKARAESTQAQQRSAAGATAAHEEQVATLTAQVRRLTAINQEMREANQTYAKTILDLRQSNEALQIDAEDLQAATEEVETLNEELQATNEELETLNEELQATVEELHTANDELETRGRELVEFADTRERMRQESETERTRLAAILEGMGDAVLVVDAAGRALVTNAAYDRIFGRGRGEGEEEKGQAQATAREAVVLRDDQGQPLPPTATPQQRAARGEAFSMIFTIIDVQDKQHWYEANGQPLTTVPGAAHTSVVLIRNITDRSLRLLQEEFLSLASHELRTPLSTLTVSLDFLKKQLPADLRNENIERALRVMDDALVSQEGLVKDLVDAERLRTGKVRYNMAPVDLAAVVRQTVENAQMSAPQGQTIALAANSPLLMVHGDTLRLEQIITNLLRNAITHATNTPRIDVRLHTAGPNASEVECDVQDYGPGIPPEELPKIFSRFYQVDRDWRKDGMPQAGLGLGLYIARELARAHGGDITVAADVGKGATFTLRLPRLQAGGESSAKPS